MKPRGLRTLVVPGVLLIMSVVSGCGNENVSSNGFVRFSDGEPVQSGSVELRSLDNGARYASRISGDGAFTLTNQKGVQRCPAGEYEAVVVQIVMTEDLAADAHRHGRTVPRRYADYYTSGLRVSKSQDMSPIMIELEP